MAKDPEAAPKPVRVLQVIRPAVGGMKGQMLQVASGLQDLGFISEVACPGDSDIVQPAMAAGLTVHPIPLVGPLNPLRDLECIWVLRDIIRERHYEIVHAHGFKAGFVARLAARLAGCRGRIVTVHNHVLYRDIPRRTKNTYITVERWLARSTSRIITVSDSLRDELIEAYGIKGRIITTVHNGLDLTPLLAPRGKVAAREHYGLPMDALVFGIAARFAPQKAMDVMVRAAVPVLERFDNAYFLLAGDGPLLEAAKRQARESGMGGRILFPGFDTDVRGLLAALDVYVSSALSEGLPLATIEAMATGLPVVSTRAGGTPEVVVEGETGLMADPGDDVGLARAMFKLGHDPALRLKMGDAGRARAIAEFTEERMLARTAAVYQEVLCSTSKR